MIDRVFHPDNLLRQNASESLNATPSKNQEASVVEAPAFRFNLNNRSELSAALSISQTRLSLYMLIAGLLGFLLFRLLTREDQAIALGTFCFGMIGMWALAFMYKVRLLKKLLSDGQLRSN
ncbi:MAG: hypothetical protein AAB401_08425 [Acidobacteriota bacterium]